MKACIDERLVRLTSQAAFSLRCTRELVLVVIILAMTAASLPAQLYTILHGFNNSTDGGLPYGGLVLSGNTLYGTTGGGVFRINTDGSGFNVIKEFSAGANNSLGVYTNSDGLGPYVSLLLSGSTLYGTTSEAGANGSGTVFQLGTDGTGFTVMKHLSAAAYYNGVYTNADGKNSSGRLVLGGSMLYGTMLGGGINGYGTLFKINTNGSGFTVIHTFTKGPSPDGSSPYAGLVLSGDTLYGTTKKGGPNDSGTVFRIDTNGSNFSVIKTFSATAYDSGLKIDTNSDGVTPVGGLALSGSTLYGTASGGGRLGGGTVFQINPDGTDFVVLKSFPTPAYDASTGGSTNFPDGWAPYGDLIVSNDTLYGTTFRGGWYGTALGLGFGSGSVFQINTDGSGYAILKGFSPIQVDTSSNTSTNSDGANPSAGVLLDGMTLYGTALDGTPSGYGTVFSVQIQPAIVSFAQMGGGVIAFTWSAVVGQSYQVQYNNGLFSTNWDNLGSAFTATNSTIDTSDMTTNLTRFYRIVGEP